MEAPNVYHYRPDTGELTGMGFADPSPLEPGEWLIPANSTQTVPPDVPARHAAIFSDGAWNITEDFRGETWWKDGEPFIITILGDPTPEGFSPDGPPEAEPGEAAYWDGEKWEVLPDHRGETWWVGHNVPITVDFLGDPADQGLLPDNPPAPEEPEPEEPEPEPTDPLVLVLSKRQVNAALILAGHTNPDAFIETAIATIADETQRALALNDWRAAPYYKRDHPLLNDPDILAAAGFTPEDVDNLWLAAVELPV